MGWYQRRVHGDLGASFQANNMAVTAWLLAALAIASTCNGASIQKREAIEGRLDRQLDIFGIHFSAQYKDPAMRSKGGKWHLKVDDMKRIFPRAHSKAIEVNVDFEPSETKKPADNFKFNVKYALTHGDGDGEEKGTLMITRQKEGDMWTTKVKTTGEPMPQGTIIPKRIRNMDWEMSSDRQTKFNFDYTNPDMNRNFHVKIDRVPGKQMHVVITNGDRKHDLTFKVQDFDLSKVDGNFEIQVEGTSMGESVKGSIKGEANPKCSLMGGALQGTIKAKFENGQLNLENELNGDKIELRVKIIPGDSADIEAKKNGVTMWTYKTKRTTTRTPEKFEMELVTDMTLNSDSMLWHFLDKNYPYGAFNTRKNTLKVFVDKMNGNKFFNKFWVEINLFKDGEKTVDLMMDTRAKPYKFLFFAPRVFKRWNINVPDNKIEATLTHDIGSRLVFETNVAGGIFIEGTRGMNDKGGRDIHILTKKAGKQMMKFDLSTEKMITDDQIMIKLHDSLEIDPDSALFRRVVSKYRFLTQFQKRTGEYEFFVNKKERNVLLHKFHVKGEVKKDGQTAMKLLLSTDEKPYKFELFLPILLNRIYSDMNEYKMSVDHVPGDHLNIQTNGKKFKSFVIAKTGNNNERKIEINGKQLASGDYTLTDNSFKTKITLQNGDWLEPKVTWEGALPKSRAEAEKFFLKNNFKVSATGSKRNFDIDLSWKATKPDWDFSTPESLKVDLNAKGESPRWGNWMLSRDASFKVENKVIQVDVSGKSHFKGGLLATATPIVTEVHMKYLIPQRDLQGKFSKMINGKEYSINFPDGFGVMPQIKMGQ